MNVLAPWISELTLQQQAVLLTALRGPDGDVKHTHFKMLLRAYRGSVLVSARKGGMLEPGEAFDDFMGLDNIVVDERWSRIIGVYLENDSDAAILHHYIHFMHAAHVLAEFHPDRALRAAWRFCYLRFVEKLHLVPEPSAVMRQRLNDFKGKRQ